MTEKMSEFGPLHAHSIALRIQQNHLIAQTMSLMAQH